MLWTLLRALVRPGARPRAPPTPRRGIGAQVENFPLPSTVENEGLLRDRGQLLLSLAPPVKCATGGEDKMRGVRGVSPEVGRSREKARKAPGKGVRKGVRAVRNQKRWENIAPRKLTGQRGPVMEPGGWCASVPR